MSKISPVSLRVLMWMQLAIDQGKVDNQNDWCGRVGLNPHNIGKVKNGTQSFTLSHIKAAAKLVDGNINWLFGLEPNMIRETGKKKKAIDMLREAVAAVEAELK